MPYTTFSHGGLFGFIDQPLTLLSFFKWFEILSVAGLVGFFGFWLLVLRPTLRPLPDYAMQSPLRIKVRRLFALWWGAFLLLVFLSANASSAFQTIRMSGGSVETAMASWKIVLLQTPVGWGWMLKMAAIVLLLVLWVFRRTPGRVWLALAVGLFLCYSVSSGGHALDQGYVSWLFVTDGFHIFAASLWVGGLVMLFLFGLPILKLVKDNDACALLTGWLERFAGVAAPAVLVLIVTGMYSAWTRIPNVESLSATPYGGTMVFKVALVGLTVGIGGLSRFYILPNLRKLRLKMSDEVVASGRLRQRFWAFIGVEAAIAILIVIVAAAVLTQLPPPYWFVAQ
ncbi:MAG: copper resistance D family protein [Nitrospirota bacterium]